ncbi:MAG: aminotransferase class V-fold PLP-dependent enzyme [Acutalibacteraceae bacterium]
MIYLDNAATTSPKPQQVVLEANNGMLISANPGRSGHDMSMRAAQKVFAVRQKLADFFECPSPENVVFTQNCTHSLNTAIRGMTKCGDHVITSCLEHNSVVRVLERLKQEGRITYDTATVYPKDPRKTLDSFRSLIKSNTAMIVCTHASNVTGTLLPIEEIGRLAGLYKLKFVVDAAQSAGTVPISMKKDGISALCLPGHKGLYGAMGTGALLLAEGIVPEPLTFGGTGSESMKITQPDFLPDRLESGTLNLPGIMSVGAGVDFVSETGLEKIHEYEMNLCDDLYNYLYNSNSAEVYSDNSRKFSVPTVAFNIKGLHSEEVARRLNDDGICVRAGYHCSYLAHKYLGTEETGAVRVSVGVFNRKNEIKKLINSINKIEKQRFI